MLFLHEKLNLWSIAGTALILGYMMMLGLIKVIESGKHADNNIEEDLENGDTEKGVLLEPHKTTIDGYGATATNTAPKVAWHRQDSTSLDWHRQGSNSF